MYRFDFVFSYWIFSWYLLYWVGIVYNPKFALTLGILYNMILLSNMKWTTLTVAFIVGNFFIKVVPLWTLRHTWYDVKGVYSTFCLFGIYCIYLYANGTSVFNIVSYQWKNSHKNVPLGPLSQLIYPFLQRHIHL